MILLLVGIGLTILMVFITRQLMISLPPERFRSVLRLLLPAYLLLNLYFTLLMREPGEDYPIILTPLHSYFAILGWDIEELSALRQILQGAWNEPAALTLEPLISIIQNIVLFIPFGFCCSPLAVSREHRAFCCSASFCRWPSSCASCFPPRLV